MLKISIISDSDQAVQFQLEGKLVGPWVEELQRLSDDALSHQKAGLSTCAESRCSAISREDKYLS